MDKPKQNTDIEIWRKDKIIVVDCKDDAFAPSIHVTEHGNIGINIGGYVIVKSVEDWHKLASDLTVREVMEWMKNNKKWLKVHSTGEVETNIASGHFISLDELKKLIRG